ncbi:MAG TPA: MlaD family protein [Holophagaceae bacterium]|nr:MlaD family protein [Holophagaceae bacterium]
MIVERNDAKVGLFVLMGLGLFIGLVVLKTAKQVTERTYAMKAKLARLEGVDVGTEVQLQGWRVGRVERVELQREGTAYSFIATLSVKDGIRLWEGTKAVVVPKGLGGVAVSFELPEMDARTRELAPGALLPGDSGVSLGGVLEKVDALLENLDGAVSDLRAKGAGVVLDHPQVKPILRSLQATLDAYQALGSEARTLATKGGHSLEELDKGLAALSASSRAVQQLLEKRGPDLDKALADLPAVMSQMKGLTANLQDLLAQDRPDIDATLKALRRDLESAEELVEILKQKPNRLVFGTPGKAEKEAARKAVEAKRKPAEAKP